MNGTIETIFISVIGLLALAFFVAVFIDVARSHRIAKRRGCVELTEKEMAVILAALLALEGTGDNGTVPKEENKEEGDGKDEAL